MNAAVRLYADAANAKTKLENGFDLTNYDERTLAFAKDYSNQLLAIDVNLDTTEMLDVAWGLFGKYFRPEEVNNSHLVYLLFFPILIYQFLLDIYFFRTEVFAEQSPGYSAA